VSAQGIGWAIQKCNEKPCNASPVSAFYLYSSHPVSNNNRMIKNYFKIAWRNLKKNKAASFINIGGLAVGMGVAMLIAFWIYDELSFDKQHQNYDRIAQVMQNMANNGEYITQKQLPIPVANELRTKFGSDFERVVLSTQTHDYILSFGDKKFTQAGNFIEPQGPDLLTLNMVQGMRDGLKDTHSILLSQALAKTLFNTEQAVGQTIHMNDSISVKVTGVYEDLPYNSTFKNVSFFAPWNLAIYTDTETAKNVTQWGDNNWQVFVQLAAHVNAETVSQKIKNIKAEADNNVSPTDPLKPQLLLLPMSRWHLYSEFKNGVNTGGRIQYVRLFAMIGIFVLLLACINFMNLSTARSEKRAKEVGIRKAIGSLRSQLVAQFYGESLLVAVISFVIALLLVLLALPMFNTFADKQISIPWFNPLLWLAGITFSVFTGLIAGSYPALYLSSFEPIKVLKGVFKTGKLASLPRKVLVVTQFTVSIAMIIGTIIVFQQIQYARNRPVGYSRNGLVNMETHTTEIYGHYDAFREDLLKTGAVAEVAQSTSPVTEMRNQQANFNWRDKDPNVSIGFATQGVTPEYAKTVGLQFVAGRDFRRSDGFKSYPMILSESAVKKMGFKEPIGEIIEWFGFKFTVIGVVKDMVMDSPYAETYPTIFFTAPFRMRVLNIRINPNMSAADALARITPVFSNYSPNEPFDYKFADQEYDSKFRAEQRVGSLASFFAVLAVFISCLGLFGLASFVAEQRTKEIGLRKVLGASVFNIWQMLSKDFVVLIALSCLLAIPIAWFYLHQWLQQYVYHTEISWWIIVATILGSLLVALLTVSFQAIRAALSNPVKSLRAE
jgi:putative ABC transport system permease protein